MAEVLPNNRRMLATFVEAGYRPTQRVSDGVVSLTFDIEPTPQSAAVRAAREHRRSRAASRGCWRRTTVAVVGAGRTPGGLGHEVLRHVVDGGFTGDVVAVNAQVAAGETVGGVPAYPRCPRCPTTSTWWSSPCRPRRCSRWSPRRARIRAAGLVVVSAGFAEADDAGRQRQADLVALARGPGCASSARMHWGCSTLRPR